MRIDIFELYALRNRADRAWEDTKTILTMYNFQLTQSRFLIAHSRELIAETDRRIPARIKVKSAWPMTGRLSEWPVPAGNRQAVHFVTSTGPTRPTIH
jgi:hypothetical protein